MTDRRTDDIIRGTQVEGFPGNERRTREDAMLKRCAVRVREIEGQTLTDYGLVLALIAVVCAGVMTLFGETIDASLAALAAGLLS
jgi:Flp pilus assembly pilin Flp